jgi:mono/diheme cytochrome c family protein
MSTVFGFSSCLRSSLIALAVYGSSAVNAQSATRPDILVSGRQSYIESCAFCHGDDARGNGLAAETLETHPADLTRLSEKNEGRFPWQAVYETVDGREMPGGHGSRDMPIFGDRWTVDLPAEYADYYTRGRILEILLYLRSIQE